MTHGEDTARKYYRRIQGVEESVLAYQATAGTRKRKPEVEDSAEIENPLPLQPTLKKRLKWLPEEEEEIKVDMDLNGTPSIDECAAFLALKDRVNLFQGRTPKELQDKCRTIRRKLSKSS